MDGGAADLKVAKLWVVSLCRDSRHSENNKAKVMRDFQYRESERFGL
jgi:hypothetical protein